MGRCQIQAINGQLKALASRYRQVCNMSWWYVLHYPKKMHSLLTGLTTSHRAPPECSMSQECESYPTVSSSESSLQFSSMLYTAHTPNPGFSGAYGTPPSSSPASPISTVTPARVTRLHSSVASSSCIGLTDIDTISGLDITTFWPRLSMPVSISTSC